MRYLLLIFTAAALVGCKRETFHESVKESTSNRQMNSTNAALGVNAGNRTDTLRPAGEKPTTEVTPPGSSNAAAAPATQPK